MSKRINALRSACPTSYTNEQAVQFLIDNSSKNFVESIDLSLHLNIDPRKADQNVRGYVNLPYGTGRTKKVIVITESFSANDIPQAYKVGGKELIDFIAETKKIDFDDVVATPDMMKFVSKISKILGPKGMMPNIKLGTLSMDADKTTKQLISNIAKFKNEKAGIVHVSVGTCVFTVSQIIENLSQAISSIKSCLSSSAKGIKKGYISSTMGPSFMLSVDKL